MLPNEARLLTWSERLNDGSRILTLATTNQTYQFKFGSAQLEVIKAALETIDRPAEYMEVPCA